MSQDQVETLSLNAYKNPQSRAAFVSALCRSLQRYGFVVIKDHQLDSSLLEHARQLNHQLFDLPLKTKLSYSQTQDGQRGYTAFGKERAKGNPQADLKEFWHIGPELSDNSRYLNRYPKNVWPSQLPPFKATMLELRSQLLAIAVQLLQAIGEGFDIDADYFPKLVEDGNSVLRLIHYPPTQGLDTQQMMRAAPHADINLMTLLIGASDAGLQLLDQQGQWIEVNAEADEIIVDTGDMMALISGGTLPATVHRVVNPSSDNKARYSMPFFLHPHADAKLACLKQFINSNNEPLETQPVITADEFLQQRLKENGLSK